MADKSLQRAAKKLMAYLDANAGNNPAYHDAAIYIRILQTDVEAQRKAKNEARRAAADAEAAAKALRAEVEELRKSQGAEMFLTLTGEITGLRAEVERLRKDAERYQWARRPENGNALFTLTGSGECGPNMDAAIDAAMGKGGKADG